MMDTVDITKNLLSCHRTAKINHNHTSRYEELVGGCGGKGVGVRGVQVNSLFICAQKHML